MSDAPVGQIISLNIDVYYFFINTIIFQGGEWWLKMEEMFLRNTQRAREMLHLLSPGPSSDWMICLVEENKEMLMKLMMEQRGGRVQEAKWPRKQLQLKEEERLCPIPRWHLLSSSTWSKPHVLGVGVWKWSAIHILSFSKHKSPTWLGGKVCARLYTHLCRYGAWVEYKRSDMFCWEFKYENHSNWPKSTNSMEMKLCFLYAVIWYAFYGICIFWMLLCCLISRY